MKLERSIDIPASREIVWRMAHAAEERPIWDVRVASMSVEGEVAAGVPFTLAWRTPVMLAESTGEYLVVEAPARSVVRVGEATVPIVPPGTTTWLFEERKGGTRVTVRFESDPAAERLRAGFLLRLLMQRDTGRSLKNLRRLVEESAVADTVAVPVYQPQN